MRVVETMSAPGEGFPYSPLDQESREIRILVLDPGTSGSRISFHLKTASFKNERHFLEYEALSYEWGDSTRDKQIFIRDHAIEVRENLWYALDALRLPNEPRFLWIDAICINQNDISERNHQVQQMADIYSQASRVLVWLGTATPQSRLAMSHLRKLSALLYDKPKPSVGQMARSPQKWAALLNLLEKSYWSRVWIVQEIGLAKEIQVICGEDQVPWAVVQDLIQCLETIDPAILPKAAVFVKSSLPAKLQKHRIAHENGSCTLSGLLEDCAESLCTVPHDKIYGFLGLANDCRGEDFLIDYEKSTLELHADVVSFQIEKKRNEEFASDWFPSWISKSQSDLFYFGQLVFELLGCRFGTDIEPFNLTQSQRWVAPVTDHYVELKVDHGLAKISALRQPSEDPKTWIQRVRMPAIVDWTTSWGPKYFTQYFDSHNEMLLLPDLHHVLHISAPSSKVLLARQERKFPEEFVPSDRTDDEPPLHDAHYVQGVNFWSDSGYLGIVPRGTTIGDYLY